MEYIKIGGKELAGKLQIRTVEKSDLDFIHKMRKNNDIMQYWCGEPYTTKEKVLKNYEDRQTDTTIREFIIYQDDEKIGYTSLFNLNFSHRTGTFGIMLDPYHQGNGHAADSTRLIVEYGFNILNLNKINLDVVDYNKKAIHVYKKVGFQIEGEKKQQYYINGKYTNGLLMGLLKGDYKPK